MSELGEITRVWTITFDRKSKHSPQRLWQALTDPDEVSKWMAYPARIDLRPGGEYHVDFSRDNSGELDGVIVRVEPERLLAYVWGYSVIEWTIEPDGDGCRYTFADHGNPTTEAGVDISAGWHAWLDSLDAHLDGKTLTRAQEQEHSQRVTPAYKERLDEVLNGP